MEKSWNIWFIMIYPFTLIFFPTKNDEPNLSHYFFSSARPRRAEISEKPDMILLEVEVLKNQRQGGASQLRAFGDLERSHQDGSHREVDEITITGWWFGTFF